MSKSCYFCGKECKNPDEDGGFTETEQKVGRSSGSGSAYIRKGEISGYKVSSGRTYFRTRRVYRCNECGKKQFVSSVIKFMFPVSLSLLFIFTVSLNDDSRPVTSPGAQESPPVARVSFVSPVGNATVIGNAVNVRAEPTVHSTKVGHLLHAGDPVQVTGDEAGWYRLMSATQTGWVKMEYVRLDSEAQPAVPVDVQPIPPPIPEPLPVQNRSFPDDF